MEKHITLVGILNIVYLGTALGAYSIWVLMNDEIIKQVASRYATKQTRVVSFFGKRDESVGTSKRRRARSWTCSLRSTRPHLIISILRTCMKSVSPLPMR